MTLLRLGNDPGGTPECAGPGDGAGTIQATLILLPVGGRGLRIGWLIGDLLADSGVKPIDRQFRLALTEGERKTGSSASGPRAKFVDSGKTSAALQI